MVALAAAYVVIRLVFPSETFCSLVDALALAIETGESILETLRGFMEADPASLVDDLSEAARAPARALVAAAQLVLKGAGILWRDSCPPTCWTRS